MFAHIVTPGTADIVPLAGCANGNEPVTGNCYQKGYSPLIGSCMKGIYSS